MKVSLVSDIHAEFGAQTLPGGEVLLLAGDICESRTLQKEFHSTRVEPYVPGGLKSYDFFYHECSKYEKVFMVMGNHEHYHGRFDKTYNELKSMLPANVTLLENEAVEYKGVMFMGATLWTDLNKGDTLTSYHLKYMMNDYKVVKNHYIDRDVYHKLTPEHTFKTHKQTVQYFKLRLSMHRDKPFVIITHHAPSFVSVPEFYKNDYLMNGGYASDLSEFILDNENIKYWVHGHMHDPVDYTIGETRILCNPRGYPSEGRKFDPALTFEIG